MKIEGKVFGYNKQLVEKYLEQIWTENQNEIQAVTQELENCKRSNQRLTMVLEDLQQEAGNVESLGLLEFASSRVRSSVSQIEQVTAGDEQLIAKKAEETRLSLNEQFAKVSQDIKREREQIQVAFKRVAQVLKGRNFRIGDASDPNTLQPPDQVLRVIQGGRSQEPIAIVHETLAQSSTVYPVEVAQELMSVAVGIDKGINVNQSEQMPDKLEMSKQIQAVRHKYVLGKLAGKDLLDHSGNLVVEKGTVITLDALENVQREGKLTELIVNMVMPGMDE